MARYTVPPNSGKVRVAMGQAGTFAVWNGKQGKDEFRILIRMRKTADALATIINRREHFGVVDVVEPNVVVPSEVEARAFLQNALRPSRTTKRREQT